MHWESKFADKSGNCPLSILDISCASNLGRGVRKRTDFFFLQTRVIEQLPRIPGSLFEGVSWLPCIFVCTCLLRSENGEEGTNKEDKLTSRPAFDLDALSVEARRQEAKDIFETSSRLLRILEACVLLLAKMKGLPRPWPYHRSLAFLCLLGLRVMSLNSVEAQLENITTATQLLALKEGELRSFVAAVEANARNCDALSGCSGSNCSRLTCYAFGTPGDIHYSCLGVANNTFCTPGNATCMQRNFDFTRSFIRRLDPVDDHIVRTVCTQRFLDEHFKSSTMNDPSHFFRVYFGAVDGTHRTYPGTDEGCQVIYDPRIRPWYLQSTYIPKVVTVLIDTGLNMRGTISGTNDETYISKAITTALKFLDTLTEDEDYVTFVCFDGDGVKQLNVTMKYNSARMYQSFNDSLAAVVAIGSKSDPNSTHTNDAINATISQIDLLTSSNSIPETYLKVVIALIGGQQYGDIADLNLSATPNMNLFVYSFRTRQAPQCNAATRASLEEVPDDRLNNPLYALQSYYSFLAKLHIDFMKNQTDFGPQYQDFSGIDAHTLTLSRAAFGPYGELLGVMGLDFFEKKLEQEFPTIQFASVVEEAANHDPGRSFDTDVDLTRTVCFDHTDACPGLATATVQGFLCGNVTNPDPDIGCCGSCKVSISPSIAPSSVTSTKNAKSWPERRWYVIVICGIVFLLLVAVVVGIIVKCCCDPNRAQRPDGRTNDAAIPSSNGEPGRERTKGLEESGSPIKRVGT